MQSLKLHLLCNRIAISFLNYKFHTGPILLDRRRRGPRIPEDPGLRHQKALYEDDSEFLENLENEQDSEAEEADFMNVDRAYDEHFREKKRERNILKKKVIVQKFFSPAQQPAMLTQAERESIKFLHKKDPVQWDVKTLSESFPATPEIILKVLRSKWKVAPERQKEKDEKVQKNWELLEEGKLDADPKVIKHLKKFVNRRQGILDQLRNIDIYLPEKENEYVWNNGEMSNIITHYERLIENLEKREKADKALEIYDQKSTKIQKSCVSLIREIIEKERKAKNVEEEESFIIGETFKANQKEMTFEELQSEVINKAEAKESLHLSEKAILESKLGISSYNKNDPAMSNAVSTESVRPHKNNGSTQNGIKYGLPSKMFEKETTVREITNDENECNVNIKKREEEKLKKNIHCILRNSSGSNQVIPPPDKNTFLVSESEIGKVLSGEKKLEQVSSKQDEVVNEVVEESGKVESEREMRERLHYEKEENDIKNTPFWNNARTSKDKALAEFEKAPLGAPKNLDNITQADISCKDHYPERIDIPKNKRGSGLTFKVKDCYYDDDGEFLYRVPGITK